MLEENHNTWGEVGWKKDEENDEIQPRFWESFK